MPRARDERRLGSARKAQPASPHPARDPVEANARLTSSTAVVLLVLFAVEGFTLLSVHRMLSLHVFVGLLLVPPVVVKVGSTGSRFVRYYLGSPSFRGKGPPPLVLRLLGPVLVTLTGAVLASGVALLLAGPSSRPTLLFLHKATFVLWFGAMTIHVLGHISDTAKHAAGDWVRGTRRTVSGARLRQWTLVASLAVGTILGWMFLSRASTWWSAVTHIGR